MDNLTYIIIPMDTPNHDGKIYTSESVLKYLESEALAKKIRDRTIFMFSSHEARYTDDGTFITEPDMVLQHSERIVGVVTRVYLSPMDRTQLLGDIELLDSTQVGRTIQELISRGSRPAISCVARTRDIPGKDSKYRELVDLVGVDFTYNPNWDATTKVEV